MSSHHIIREDQEPALLILDTMAVDFVQVQELLEWSPTVMVSERALKEVLSWGIKIDIVIASEENVSNLKNSLLDQSPVKLHSYTSKGALATALDLLISSRQKAVNVFATEPLESFEVFSSLDISVFHSGKRWSYIRNRSYEKWFPTGRIILVHSANDQSVIRTEHEGVITINRDYNFWVSEE